MPTRGLQLLNIGGVMACLYFPITKNKSFELQLNFFDSLFHNDVFELNINWTIQQDHAGPSFTFVLYRTIFFKIQIYDNRHWNYEKNTWETYENN
jgi:hypothetical protein